MSLYDQKNLAAQPEFQGRVAAAAVHTALAAMTETTNEVQTITVTGTPTGGSFTLASLPGSVVNVQVGTLTSAAATCTGLASTVGLFVGMAVTGTNVLAGTTVAAITSATAITLSANASGSGAQTLTFSGTPLASIPFNADAATVQARLQALANIGTDKVVCTGGPFPGTPVVITFNGTFGGTPQALITIGTNSLTGGSTPTPSVARTTAGVSKLQHVARVVLAKLVLANPTGYGQMMALGVADNATVQGDFPAPGYTLNVSEATASNDVQFQMDSIFNSYC